MLAIALVFVSSLLHEQPHTLQIVGYGSLNQSLHQTSTIANRKSVEAPFFRVSRLHQTKCRPFMLSLWAYQNVEEGFFAQLGVWYLCIFTYVLLRIPAISCIFDKP